MLKCKEIEIDGVKINAQDQIETFMNINRICLVLRFYDILQQNGSERGQTGELFISTIDFVRNSDGEIVSFDITPWFTELFNDELDRAADKSIEQEQAEKTGKGGFMVGVLTKEELETNGSEFLKALFKYARPIIMFLIFIVIIYTGIFAIMNNQDAKQRVLVKEKLYIVLLNR